jgi:hypothetical protein
MRRCSRWARSPLSRSVGLPAGAGLCALCLVVLASALKRLGLYEDVYGATRLRDVRCVAWRIAGDLREPDGLLGANLARARARAALAGLPEPDGFWAAY